MLSSGIIRPRGEMDVCPRAVFKTVIKRVLLVSIGSIITVAAGKQPSDSAVVYTCVKEMSVQVCEGIGTYVGWRLGKEYGYEKAGAILGELTGAMIAHIVFWYFDTGTADGAVVCAIVGFVSWLAGRFIDVVFDLIFDKIAGV